MNKRDQAILEAYEEACIRSFRETGTHYISKAELELILSAQPEESETCLCGLDTRECGGCMDGELMPEESDKEDDWISVDERLPEDSYYTGDWFWVKRQGGIELMHGAWEKWQEPHVFRWQDPRTVGDHEGIWTEYYDDITHWRPLVPPEEEECGP